MIIPVKVPAIGESVTEAVIAKWHRSDGDRVAVDDPLCTFESDKAAVEIQAEAAGRLRILKPQGYTVPVGGIIAEIDTEPANRAASTGAATSPAVTAAAAPPADATVYPPPAPVYDNTRPVPPFGGPAAGDAPRLTPTAARILEQAAVPFSAVQGTGPHGRVTKEDALEAVRRSGVQPAATPVSASVPSPVPVPAPQPVAAPSPSAAPPAGATGRASRREAMTPLRRTIARRLLQAKQETAMLTTINEVDMTAVQAVRRANQDAFTRKYGVKLGYMSFFARAVCLALAEVPVVNACAGEDYLEYHDFVDLSVAVSTPRGLVVPVVRNAQALGIPQLETAIQAFAKKARDGRLSLDEMTGGTFTLTNGGTFGSLISTPLINPPQSAILGMHVIQDRPVARDGQVVIRPMMYISLSYDHRLIDGRESVQFVVKVKEWLERVSPATAGL